MSLRRILYSLFLYLIFPLVLFRLFWKSRSNPAYRHRIFERLGFVSINNSKPIIWVHAVSVGETIGAQPLITSLIDQYPDHKLLVTTTTPTGSAIVEERFNCRVEHTYFPYDLPGVIKRFLKRVSPCILIVIETEIWPNLYAECRKNGIPLLILNARLSPKSTLSYVRYKNLMTETLSNVTLISVRSTQDKKRFEEIGATEQIIEIAGNIKYDCMLDQVQIDKGKSYRSDWGEERLVWVAASTHGGEDKQILDIYCNLLALFPTMILVLVPRHPERFDEVFQQCLLLEKERIYTQRQSLVIHQEEGYVKTELNIVLGDSMGEMQTWIAAADVVFIGGSLVATGGHNPLEAVMQGVPVVSGKHMYNFEDISSELSQENLLYICDSAVMIEEKIRELLQLEVIIRNDLEEKAKSFMHLHNGVTDRLMKSISNHL